MKNDKMEKVWMDCKTGNEPSKEKYKILQKELYA